VHRLPGKTLSFLWGMREFQGESAARRYAKIALSNGLQVEAGTLPEIEPQVRVPRGEAMAWAESNEG
jgi:hypothetical protein